MTIPRWEPRTTYTKQEEMLMKRLTRTRKLFAFLREYRDFLFDEAFQDELAQMYRQTGAGKVPVAPALMAMAMLVQGYLGVSDAEAVELTVVDMRWQLVLDRLGETEPAFSQGALQAFRERMIAHDMDRRLLERTVLVARATKGFDAKKLPSTLRVALDSSPLEGAGRVEDTINLLAHAGRKVVMCAAELTGRSMEQLAREAGAALLLESSVKRGLDVDWTKREHKAEAVSRLAGQLDALERWVTKNLGKKASCPPLSEHLETLAQIRAQDLEPDPSGGGSGKVRVRRGVAPDRRVSIEDKDMRHGRKSKSKRFNGYKRHIAVDLDDGLILGACVLPANRPEEDAAPELAEDISHLQDTIDELYTDRGYIGSDLVYDVLDGGGEVVCRPWRAPANGDRYSKADFHIDMRRLTITCPAGESEHFSPGSVVEFDPETCHVCEERVRCTMATSGSGRTVRISENEALQKRLRRLQGTRSGRERLRTRVVVEHKLAHISQRQGRRARYRGTRKNLYDLRRASALQNLENLHRYVLAKAA
jgi:hypothetical protein